MQCTKEMEKLLTAGKHLRSVDGGETAPDTSENKNLLEKTFCRLFKCNWHFKDSFKDSV